MNVASSESSTNLSPAELALLIRAQLGNLDALNELMLLVCKKGLQSVARTYKVFTYEELHNEIFIVLADEDCKLLRKLPDPDIFPSYVWRAASWKCLARLRKDKKLDFLDTKELLAAPDPQAPAFDIEIRRSQVIRAINKLEDRKHRIVLHGTMKGTPLEAIAKALGVDRGYIDTIKNRAIKKLHESLRARQGGHHG